MKPISLSQRMIPVVFVFLILALALRPACGAVAWTGTGGTSWSITTSWTPTGTGPSTTDTASFTDTGSTTILGDVTSVLNADRTIGGLSFVDSAGHYHTLDLAAHTLTVTGNLNFNIDQNASSVTTIRDGALVVNGAFANVSVGRAVSGTAIGTVDFSGLTTFTATVQNVLIGTSTANNANGIMTLAATNTITADTIQVGVGVVGHGASGSLTLGHSNTIVSNQFIVGQSYAGGSVQMSTGGSLTLGSSLQPTTLAIGNSTTYTDAAFTATFNVAGSTFNAFLGDLTVSSRNGGGGAGGLIGTLTGGSSGAIVIGSVSNLTNVNIGVNLTGPSSTGTVDFTGQTSLTSNLNTLTVGYAASGSASGTFKLARTSTISANSILVGIGTVGSGASGTLVLGNSNTITTTQLIIGQSYASGLVQMAPGGVLNLGSAAQRTSLILGDSNTYSDASFTGKLDLSGGTFNAYLGDLNVGERSGGGGVGSMIATLLGGNGGFVDMGTPSALANLFVGRNLTGPSSTGTVDFSGLATLHATLNQFTVGYATAGSATGSLALPAVNTISAATILIGGGTATSSGTLTLGQNNTLLANQFMIAQDAGSGTVILPPGGVLALGSPSQRVNLSIDVGTTTTNGALNGTLDLTNASVTAYLDNVIIGNKSSQGGSVTGTFTISNHADNHVEINTLSLGGASSTANFNFAGGALFIGSVTKGAGTANFSWTGGTLSVTTFGTAALPFNLANNAGILAPGLANGNINTSTVNGNYTQGSAATLALRIAGNSPGVGNDQLAVNGTATLAGTLNLSLVNGFTPAIGQDFLLATYTSHTGSFTFVAPPVLPQNVAFVLDYTSNPTQLLAHTAAPVIQNWTNAAATGTFSTASNWDTATTPGTLNTDQIANTTATPRTITVGSSTTVHRITLAGTNAALDLEVPQGITLGVSNQLVVGANALLTGGGQILGAVVVNPQGLLSAQAAGATFTLSGGATSTGTVQALNGATLAFAGPSTTLAGGIQATGSTLSFNSPTTTLSAPLTLANASATFSGSAQTAAITGTGTLTVAANATLVSAGVALSGNWIINGSQQIRPGSGAAGTSVLTNAPVFAKTGSVYTGKLDLADNHLILASTDPTDKAAKILAINTALAAGKNNNTWTGNGITSSTVAADPSHLTLGVYDNAALHSLTNSSQPRTNWAGQTVDTNSVLITPALKGDANLDGIIDIADMIVIANNWNLAGKSNGISTIDMAHGDVNQDGVVDIADMVVVANNWNSASSFNLAPGPASEAPTPAPVPEPASLILLAIAPVLLGRARRRN